MFSCIGRLCVSVIDCVADVDDDELERKQQMANRVMEEWPTSFPIAPGIHVCRKYCRYDHKIAQKVKEGTASVTDTFLYAGEELKACDLIVNLDYSNASMLFQPVLADDILATLREVLSGCTRGVLQVASNEPFLTEDEVT